MRRDKTSVSQEDYLKAVWEMLEEDQTPISARLAEELNVTPPAVTAALKRMTRDGHVRVDREGRIDLTRKGRQFAERLALRHQLAEMLLTDVMLLKRFADKKSCPHGVPMRGGIAKLRKQGAVPLSDLRANDKAEILCVYEKDAQFLEFLEKLELRPETQVAVKKREYDETITLRAGGRTMHLGKPATTRIWVRKIGS